MVKAMKFLGSTKITGAGSIQIIKAAAEFLDAKVGDHILFYTHEPGKIIIMKG